MVQLLGTVTLGGLYSEIILSDGILVEGDLMSIAVNMLLALGR